MPDANKPDPGTHDKASWRAYLQSLRSSIPATGRAAASDAISQRFISLAELSSGVSVLAYASADAEVETYTLIETLLAAGVEIALPVIGPHHTMQGYRIEDLKGLAPDRFGLLAPTRRRESDQVEQPEVIVVPGIGFDPKSGHRLGRGAGYYDRYLATRPHALTVGLAFEEQIVHGLPYEPHDVPMRVIVAPSRVLRCA